MTRFLKAAAASAALAMAVPALAQYVPAPPPGPPPPPPAQPQMQLAQPQAFRNVIRLNLGVSFYNNGWYNCYYGYYYGTCTSGSYTSYVPFVIGPQIDFAVGRGAALGIGVMYNTGSITFSYYDVLGAYISGSNTATMWEPTVDYVARFGPPTAETLGRMRIGGGMYFGSNGGFGGAFRIGGGASFLNTNRLGIGLDVMLEAGSYQGYWIGGLQLVVSPEYHF
ncbi:MAG TPA: hypothetical protein VFR85_19655 [Anaeromyxobacteraceae bacterium]|nr:hypothetical protein [Anaeromyxobacteraceae bacterium]